MKRLFLLLASAIFISASCSLHSATAQPRRHGPRPHPIRRTAPHIAPSPRHTNQLQVAEDPGTGLYGYLNNFGAWVIRPTFRSARAFDSEVGFAVVQLTNGQWGAINRMGQTAIQFNFRSWLNVDSAIRSISKGRYRGIDLWETYDHATDLWGYLDYTGAWFIAPQYKSARAMSDRGVALVQFQDGRWGAINRNGQIVVQPNFNSWLDVDSALRNLRLY